MSGAYGLSKSHTKISQQVKHTISAGLRQLFGLQIKSSVDFFMAIDRDQSGHLDSKEIFNGLKRLGAAISGQQIDDWVEHLDADDNGEIDALEFVMHVDDCSYDMAELAISEYKPVKAAKATRTREQKKPEAINHKNVGNHLTKKLQKLLKKGKVMVNGTRLRGAVSLFNAIDSDFSGTLSNNEIKDTMKSLHIGVSDHDIMHWILSMDDDGSGAVDASEFLKKVLGRPATEAELKDIKGGPDVDSGGNKITHNLKRGKGGGVKQQNEAMTKQILLSLESSYKRSVFGHFVHDSRSLFHALDRDTSGAVDKEELAKGLRRLGIHCSLKQMSQWVDHLKLNDEGEITQKTFVSTLNRANQLTRHIHELCHHGGRQMFGIFIVDAASFFFAVDQDKSGDLTLAEIKRGLQEIRGEVGHGAVTDAQIEGFVKWLDVDKSGDIDAVEFITKVDYVSLRLFFYLYYFGEFFSLTTVSFVLLVFAFCNPDRK